MTNILHFDCSAGISGDMTLGALVDLGVDPDELRKELEKLSLDGWSLEFVRETRNGIAGMRALVKIEEDINHRPHRPHGRTKLKFQLNQLRLNLRFYNLNRFREFHEAGLFFVTAF